MNVKDSSVWLKDLPLIVMLTVSSLPLAAKSQFLDPIYLGCYPSWSIRRDAEGNGHYWDNCFCRGTCRRHYYKFAATHDGIWCFCSNLVKFDIKADPSACNVTCSKNILQICGGVPETYALSVYRVCPYGRFGILCNKTCPTTCKQSTCDPINGTCEPCPFGYRGAKCDRRCPDRTYGYGCMKNCSGHCAYNASCSVEDGSCPGEKCQDGFVGAKCDRCPPGKRGATCYQRCPVGTYGYGCKDKCSGHCANNAFCSFEDGSCPGGLCQDGFVGVKCETKTKPSKSNRMLGNKRYVIIATLIIFFAEGFAI